jgi:hypothetical protein
MKSKLSISLTSLVAMIAMSGVVSSSAFAREPPNWKVNGAFLGANGEKNVFLKSTTAIEFKIPLGATIGKCMKSEGSGTVKGASEATTAGTGSVTSLGFSECSTTAANCTLEHVEGVNFEILGWPTTLFRTNEASRKVADKLENITIDMKYSLAAMCELKGTQEVKGNVSGAVNNATESLEFKSPPVEGSTLKTFGGSVSIILVGTYKLSGPGINSIEAE